MDKSNQVIIKVTPQKMPKLEIETNTGNKYVANLSKFLKVYCFPKSQSEWNDVSITTAGYSLTWSTRFEVHVDQVIDAAQIVQQIKKRA